MAHHAAYLRKLEPAATTTPATHQKGGDCRTRTAEPVIHQTGIPARRKELGRRQSFAMEREEGRQRQVL
jgi:hypothetical protein